MAENGPETLDVHRHGTQPTDPTLAALPFLVATGAGSTEIDCVA